MREAPADCPLTYRELAVLAALAGGASNDVIALDLGIPRVTVRKRLHSAYRRLGIPPQPGRKSTRNEAIARARPWLDLVREPPEDPDPPLTPVHHAYGYLIDRHFTERTRCTEALVTAGYVALMGDTGVHPAAPRSQPDVGELLLRMARALQRPI